MLTGVLEALGYLKTSEAIYPTIQRHLLGLASLCSLMTPELRVYQLDVDIIEYSSQLQTA